VTSPAVFLDRDGTLLDELGFLARPEELRLLPGVAAAVRRLSDAGFRVVVVTNQSGIARGLFSADDLARVHERLERELAQEDARLDLILHCPHHPEHGEPPLRARCACRKPEPGLFFEAARRLSLDLERSWVVGDSARDLEAGRRAGVPGRVLVATGKGRATLAQLIPDQREGLVFARDLPEAVEEILRHELPQGV
jgi:D-glycero-D-manno-heptose 1,7-bisphosphate phosphatase